MHPEIDVLFSGILEKDPAAIIVMVEGAVCAWTSQVLDRMGKVLGDNIGRIKVVPRMPPEDFIALQSVADVILDTPHFSGGNTTFEAIALGKAIVTLDGAFMRGRVSAGMYRQMELMECVANDLDGYIKVAVKLGADPDFRASIEKSIEEKRGLLFDDPEVVPEFEKFFHWSIGQLG